MAGRWFPPGTLISSTNKTDLHHITELLLKVALNKITLTLMVCHWFGFITVLIVESISIIINTCLLPDAVNRQSRGNGIK